MNDRIELKRVELKLSREQSEALDASVRDVNRAMRILSIEAGKCFASVERSINDAIRGVRR